MSQSQRVETRPKQIRLRNLASLMAPQNHFTHLLTPLLFEEGSFQNVAPIKDPERSQARRHIEARYLPDAGSVPADLHDPPSYWS